jgi:hypothetical protein
MEAIQKQLDVERALVILESSKDIDELRLAKGRADVMLAAAKASGAIRTNAKLRALCESADIRYRRTLGEILARMPKAEGAKGKGKKADESAITGGDGTTLAELGITLNESSQCQRLATLPAEVFTEAVNQGVEAGKPPTVSALLKMADKEEVSRLLPSVTPAAREILAELPVKPRDVRAVIEAGAKADPSKRALAEKQVASTVRRRANEATAARASTAATAKDDTAPAADADIATPKDIADAFLELNDEERAECLERMQCVAFATLRSLREQREHDESYKLNRRLSEPRPGAADSAHVIAAVLDGGDAALAMLGLDWGTTPDQVKAAYHKAALIHHPDKGGNGARMADLSKAYAVALKYAERRGRGAA